MIVAIHAVDLATERVLEMMAVGLVEYTFFEGPAVDDSRPSAPPGAAVRVEIVPLGDAGFELGPAARTEGSLTLDAGAERQIGLGIVLPDGVTGLLADGGYIVGRLSVSPGAGSPFRVRLATYGGERLGKYDFPSDGSLIVRPDCLPGSACDWRLVATFEDYRSVSKSPAGAREPFEIDWSFEVVNFAPADSRTEGSISMTSCADRLEDCLGPVPTPTPLATPTPLVSPGVRTEGVGVIAAVMAQGEQIIIMLADGTAVRLEADAMSLGEMQVEVGHLVIATHSPSGQRFAVLAPHPADPACFVVSDTARYEMQAITFGSGLSLQPSSEVRREASMLDGAVISACVDARGIVTSIDR